MFIHILVMRFKCVDDVVVANALPDGVLKDDVCLIRLLDSRYCRFLSISIGVVVDDNLTFVALSLALVHIVYPSFGRLCCCCQQA